MDLGWDGMPLLSLSAAGGCWDDHGMDGMGCLMPLLNLSAAGGWDDHGMDGMECFCSEATTLKKKNSIMNSISK